MEESSKSFVNRRGGSNRNFSSIYFNILKVTSKLLIIFSFGHLSKCSELCVISNVYSCECFNISFLKPYNVINEKYYHH